MSLDIPERALAPMLLRKGAVGQRLLDRCLDELNRFGVGPEGSGRERGHQRRCA